jgi:hypothetical protein
MVLAKVDILEDMPKSGPCRSNGNLASQPCIQNRHCWGYSDHEADGNEQMKKVNYIRPALVSSDERPSPF